jgi:hypothetical protein
LGRSYPPPGLSFVDSLIEQDCMLSPQVINKMHDIQR